MELIRARFKVGKNTEKQGYFVRTKRGLIRVSIDFTEIYEALPDDAIIENVDVTETGEIEVVK